MLEATWLQSRALAAVIALLGLCGLLVGGCASTVVQAQWADPLFVGQSLRGATVLVVCNAYAPAIQRICQDQISGRMLMSGIRPVMATEADLITAVAPQLTVVTNTSARSGVAVPVKDVHAASVVPSETAAHETTAVRASSSNGQ